MIQVNHKLVKNISCPVFVRFFTLTILLVFFLGASSFFTCISQAQGTSGTLQTGGLTLPGSGTKTDPWKIGSISELEAVRRAVADGDNLKGKYLELTDDMVLPDGWQGIGTLKAGATDVDKGRNIAPFSGILSGAGHTVTTADGGKPLFGYVREAIIRNLNIAGHNIDGNGLICCYERDYGPYGNSAPKTAIVSNVTILSGTTIRGSGIISGYGAAANKVDIKHCTVEEGVVIGCDKDREKIGSLGGDFNGTITDCRSGATVYGTSYVGGIMGCKSNSMDKTVISNCVFTGKVVASGNYAGGIAGGGYGGTNWGIETAPNAMMLSINNCLCTGHIEAADMAGGIEGYETSLQTWDNGAGYITSNLFAGSITTTQGSCMGGIIGVCRGLDKYNDIKDNYYYEDCGADRGIGYVQYLDTSCSSHETEYGEIYFNSSEYIPVFEGVNDVYPDNIRKNHNRKDDPLGADAELLAKKVSRKQLENGIATAYLNLASGSLKNWFQNGDLPDIEIGPPGNDDTMDYENPKPSSGGQGNQGSGSSPSKENGNKSSGSSSKTKVKVTKLLLNYHQISLNRGRTFTLTCRVYPSVASNKKLSWSSSNKRIATVSSKGKIKTIRTGTVIITVKAKDGSGKKDSCKVRVYKNSSSSSSSSSSRSSSRSSSSSSSYYNSSSSQSGSSQNYSGTSVIPTGSSSEDSTQSQSSQPWSYDGGAYVPESSEPMEDSEDEDEDEEWEDEDEDEDEDLDEDDGGGKAKGLKDRWMKVLLGLLGSGGLAGLFKVPWHEIADKAQFLKLLGRG